MGSEAADEIQCFDFSGNDEQQRWKDMCGRIRDALETHGCFLLSYDKVPKRLLEDMFIEMNTFFDLPEETKNKYLGPLPYRSYLRKSPINVPWPESFDIVNEPDHDQLDAFTKLIWPDGNPSFCETLKSMSSKMLELNRIILKMVFESYGVGKLYDAYKQDSTSTFRLLKYRLPPNANKSEGGAISLVPHTDKNALTILCQNDVQGLQVLNNNNVYVPLIVPDNAFIVFVGDSLKGWSNGRLKAVKHRVVMSGKKERYSFGLFSMPKEGVTTEVPQELVDERHPLRYRPFKFTEFLSYFSDNVSDDALETYAGL